MKHDYFSCFMTTIFYCNVLDTIGIYVGEVMFKIRNGTAAQQYRPSGITHFTLNLSIKIIILFGTQKRYKE